MRQVICHSFVRCLCLIQLKTTEKHFQNRKFEFNRMFIKRTMNMKKYFAVVYYCFEKKKRTMEINSIREKISGERMELMAHNRVGICDIILEKKWKLLAIIVNENRQERKTEIQIESIYDFFIIICFELSTLKRRRNEKNWVNAEKYSCCLVHKFLHKLQDSLSHRLWNARIYFVSSFPLIRCFLPSSVIVVFSSPSSFSCFSVFRFRQLNCLWREIKTLKKRSHLKQWNWWNILDKSNANTIRLCIRLHVRLRHVKTFRLRFSFSWEISKRKFKIWFNVISKETRKHCQRT